MSAEHGDDGVGPRGRTLVVFGVCLGLMIVAIIVAAAVIAA